MSESKKLWNFIGRKSEVFTRIAEDFYYHAVYYQHYPPTLSNLSRRLNVTAKGLRSFLFYARIPGVSVELSLTRKSGRTLFVYLVFVDDGAAVREYFRSYLNA